MNTGHAARPTERSARRPITRLSRLLAPVGTLALLLLLAGPVAAHADLVSSEPPDGAVLDTPPTSVTLTFSEGLSAARSKFQLLASDGSLVGTGTAAADGDETMTLSGLELGPDEYLVKWTSVSLDTDIVRGELRFTVTEASSSPAPTPTPEATPGASNATPAPSVAPSEPTLEPVAVPASSDPTVVPVDGDPASSSGGLGDALLPIAVVLVVVAGVGVYLMRRSRSV